MELIQTLCDQLRHITKGTQSVSDFGRKFKNICDQLRHITSRKEPIGFYVVLVSRLRRFQPLLGPLMLLMICVIYWLKRRVTKWLCSSPHCQLCRTNGHFASECSQLASFAKAAASTEPELPGAFQAQSLSNLPTSYWFVDCGASDHMVSSFSSLTNATPPPANSPVLFGSPNEGNNNGRSM